ncbi:MAG: ATP-dependent metallopeptidase FtsH/Yme1/Tma family protein, partial [Deltaproteobacteria bacterium]|nr:ATP-dependent metallopeptidase FtsH/Yme1/Tma family protein [Deltaproteobacteria bacterium]
MSPFYKNLALWLVISLMLILVFNLFKTPQVSKDKTSYSDFLEDAEKGNVLSVTIQGENIYGTKMDGTKFKTFAPRDDSLIKTLRSSGVKISARAVEENPWYMTVLVSWFPMIMLIAVWIFFMRQMQVGGGKAMSFGKSRA